MPDSPTPAPPEAWSVAPVMDWILRRGRHISDPERLLAGICRRVRDAGMPLDRVNVFISTLHPQYFGFVLGWEDDDTTTSYGSHESFETDQVILSPMMRIGNGERIIRRRLYEADCEMDFPVLEDLRQAGYTDYVIAELVFSTGARNGVSLATRKAGGFSDHDIREVQQILHLFALLMEAFTNRGVAANLMSTYLGSISGARVLDGQIKRGDGDHIDAVIWFSDLRDSTPLAERLSHDEFLELLNDYFEATAGAVLAHGGEVLRFIGDALLAVFPLKAGEDPQPVCGRALEAAREACKRVATTNAARRGRGRTTFRFGVGLHRGEVQCAQTRRTGGP